MQIIKLKVSLKSSSIKNEQFKLNAGFKISCKWDWKNKFIVEY